MHVFCFCSDLEQYVGTLQKDSHRVVTLKDVEDGAVTLRKVGESLAGLKGKTTENTFTTRNTTVHSTVLNCFLLNLIFINNLCDKQDNT